MLIGVISVPIIIGIPMVFFFQGNNKVTIL